MHALPLVEALAARPEFPLYPEEKAEVYAYMSAVFDRPLDESVHTVGDVLRAHKNEMFDAPPFFAKPFVDGAIVHPDMPKFAYESEVYNWLAAQVEQGVPVKQLRDMAKDSLAAYKADLKQEILAGTPADQIDPRISDYAPVVLNPAATLAQFENLLQVRHMIRAEYSALKPDTMLDTVGEAKCEVLEIYLARVNDQLADYWPRISYIQDQAVRTENHELWLAAAKVIPSWNLQLALDDQVSRSAMHARLDYVRHGMGQDAQGRPSQVSQRLWELAAASTVEAGHKAPVFTPEQTALLRKAKVAPDRLRYLVEETLRRTGRLSSQDPNAEGPGKYTPERTTPAGDGWQVVEHPAKNSFMVDSLPQVVLTPKEAISWYTALVVGGAHEMEHINQAEADYAVAQLLKLAGVKGKRVSPLREGRANQNQREWETILFGVPESASPAMTYASALEELRAGKGLAAAAVAFYRRRRMVTPAKTPAAAATEAADRVVRHTRGGGYNSQALSYDEYTLLTDSTAAAPDSVRHRAGMVTCFDLSDQLRLHKYGLLPPVPERQDFMSVFLDVAREDIAAVLAENHD